MSSRERLEAAFNRAPVDTVPIAPDIWFYWPARFSGRHFWELDGPLARGPIWPSHLKVNREFGLDAIVPAWLGGSPLAPASTTTLLQDIGRRRIVRVTQNTPGGPFVRTWTVFADDAAWAMDYPVQTWEDVGKLDYVLFVDPWTRDAAQLHEAVKAVGEHGFVMVPAVDPFTVWQGLRGHEQAILDLIDRPVEVTALFNRINAQSIAYARAAISSGARVIMTGASSTSMLSPQLFRKFCVPYLAEICDAVHGAGGYVISHHHGRCRDILEDIAGYGADVIEPLQAPPTGDIDLAEAKRRIGGTCCLKGNVGTVDVLLRGGVGDVEQAVKQCMLAAKEGYGFILGTGDQVARDTPVENFRALVEYGRRYGAY